MIFRIAAGVIIAVVASVLWGFFIWSVAATLARLFPGVP